MIAIIFEVWPEDGQRECYLELARELADELKQVAGFISIERFASMSDPDKLLSLSVWLDEEAVRNWRNNPRHRTAQQAGRGGVFRDYRLRVASIIRDYGMMSRAEVPPDSPF